MFNMLFVAYLLIMDYINGALNKIHVYINSAGATGTEGMAGEEPLLPAEKKLITWSLILAVILLALLIWISYTFFPAPPSAK